MRHFWLLPAAAIAWMLTGCGENADNTDLQIRDVERPGGGTVECAVSDGYRSGGVDCNWPGA